MEKNLTGTDVNQVKITSLLHIRGQPKVIENIEELRFLLYPGRLEKQDLVQIQQDNEGVIWL